MSMLAFENVMQDVVDSMVVDGIDFINFQSGRASQIIEEMLLFNKAIKKEDSLKKFPLIAMELPIREYHSSSGSYNIVYIPRIVIANLSTLNATAKDRYSDTGNFKTILYPLYEEFFAKLAIHKFIVTQDPTLFKHQKMDSPGDQPIIPLSADYVDMVEIINLEFMMFPQSSSSGSGSGGGSGGGHTIPTHGPGSGVPNTPIVKLCSL